MYILALKNNCVAVLFIFAKYSFGSLVWNKKANPNNSNDTNNKHNFNFENFLLSLFFWYMYVYYTIQKRLKRNIITVYILILF